MEKRKIGRTAEVNLCLMAELGVPEAQKYQEIFRFQNKILKLFPGSVRTAIGAIAEVLYTSTNHRIESQGNHCIFDLACGYSPRAYQMIPKGYHYIGGDLPSVIDDIMVQLDKQAGYDEWKALYQCVDVTDAEAVTEAVRAENGRITVVTQGLITYLNAEQKHLLASNIHTLLQKNGGCWIIPDASPDKMLNETFQAITGNTFFVKLLYKIRNRQIKYENDFINWKNTEEIVAGLQAEGFHVEVIPLWEESIDLNVFEKIGEKKASILKKNWKELKSIIVSARDQR